MKISSFLVLSLVWASACSSSPTVTSVKDLPSNAADGRTGILLPVNLDARGAVFSDAGCTLSLNQKGVIKTQDIDVKAGKSSVVASLPEGTYHYKMLYCGSHSWNLQWEPATFRVYAGKISLLGELYLKLNGSRRLRFAFSSKKENRLTALELFQHLPKESQNSVVSGYTGQTIDPILLEQAGETKKWEYFDQDQKPIANPDKDWPKFKTCDVNERKINPLWLGRAVLEATYENSLLQNLKTPESWNSYTAAYLDCAKAILTNFKPKTTTRVSYTVYL